MKFKQNVVEQFLWESYNIDSWKYLYKRLEELDEPKIKEIGKNVLIQHQFQKRRFLDPGFYYHILDKIKKDKPAMKMAENYIEKLLLDGVNFDECKTFSPNPIDDCNSDLNIKSVDENLKHIPCFVIEYEDRGDGSVNLESKILPHDNSKTIEYFNQRYEMALEEGDELTTTAIRDVIYEYKTGMFPLSNLNKKSKFYWEYVNNEVIFDWLRYSYENIKFGFLNKSSGPSDQLYAGNIMSLMGLLEFEENLVDMLERFNIPTSNQKKPDFEYIKFLTDAFSIASIIWFNSLDLKEKEKLLNGNYNLDQARVTELMDKIAHNDSDKMDTLSYFAMDSFKNGFFDIAEVVYEYICKNSHDMYTKSECMDKIGDIYREKMDYTSALNYYRRAYEYSDKIQTNRRGDTKNKEIHHRINRKYGTIIASLRIAEMEYMLGQTDISNQHVSDVEEMAQKSNIDERLSILWNIACTFKRTGQYEKEYRCLDEIAELGKDRRKDLVVKTDERLLFLNNFFNNYNFKLDTKTLREHDLREKKERILEVSNLMRKSFQFEREIEYIKRELNIENDANSRLEMAFCYYNLNKMDIAEVELRKAIEDTEIPKILAFCHLYLSFIQFKHGKNDNGFLELEKCVRFGILSEKIDVLIEHCIFRLIPFKKEKLLKQALETVLNVVKTECSVEYYIPIVLKTSSCLLMCGLVSDAVFFSNIAIENSSQNPEMKVKSLQNMAGIYSIREDYEKSIEYLKQAASISPKLPEIWEDMADAYSNSFEFKQAEKCIDEALAIQPDNEKYKKLKYDYREFGHDKINFNKITDEDVEKYFLTAERIVLEFAKSIDDKEFDFSMSLVGYGKGLETMLHNRISKPFRNTIHKEHGTPIEGCRGIKEDLWYGNKNKKIPGVIEKKSTLRNILGIEEYTIPLGSWKFIFKDCRPDSKNEIIKKAHDYFSRELNTNRKSIFDACNIISEYRNGASHYTSKSKNEILTDRKEIIEHINNVINVLYN